MVVLHIQLDWASGEGEHGAVAADGVLAAAGESCEGVFIEAAGWGGVELEVGIDEGEKAGEKDEGHHDDKERRALR